jgi:hypothetical protein
MFVRVLLVRKSYSCSVLVFTPFCGVTGSLEGFGAFLLKVANGTMQSFEIEM